MPPIRVAVLSDDRLFCDGVARIVASDSCFAVVADLHDAALGTDVVLLDSRMPGALETCAALTRKPGPSIILVAAPDDDGFALDALDAGARGILARSSRADDMLSAVRLVHEGLIWARRRVISTKLDQLTRRTEPQRAIDEILGGRLSLRERQVFRHAATGLGNKELAELLTISEATVKVHLTHIFRKLGLSSRSELAAAYHGLQRQPVLYDERLNSSR